LFWGCRPSVPSTGTELGAGSVGLGARYCRVLRALGWAGATPPAYAARVWGLWAGGCRMCEAVLSVERGRMHVGLLTVGVPYMHRMEPPIPKHLAEAPAELLTALTALTVPGALVASLPDDAWLGVGLGSVKPLGFGLGLGLGLRLGLGLGLGAVINVLDGRSRAETAVRAARAASPRRQPRWCTAPSIQTRARPGGPRAAGARRGRAGSRRRAYLA